VAWNLVTGNINPALSTFASVAILGAHVTEYLVARKERENIPALDGKMVQLYHAMHQHLKEQEENEDYDDENLSLFDFVGQLLFKHSRHYICVYPKDKTYTGELLAYGYGPGGSWTLKVNVDGDVRPYRSIEVVVNSKKNLPFAFGAKISDQLCEFVPILDHEACPIQAAGNVPEDHYGETFDEEEDCPTPIQAAGNVPLLYLPAKKLKEFEIDGGEYGWESVGERG
jgi:hypothetical protein